MQRKIDFRFGGVQQVIRVGAVNNVDVMSSVTQRMRQTIDVHGIPAKAVRRVKRCQMQEIEQAAHDITTFRITPIIWRAEASQVSRWAAASPAERICCRNWSEDKTCWRARAKS